MASKKKVVGRSKKKTAKRKPTKSKPVKRVQVKANKKVPKPVGKPAKPVIRTEDRNPLEVQKALVVSTGHMTLDDNDFLGNRIRHQGKEISHFIGPYGYIIYCPEDPEDIEKTPVSRELRRLMSFARQQGCCLLSLDRDGNVLEGFPTFNW